MLVNKNLGILKEDEVVVFKLNSGEEVIGKIVSADDEEVKLYRPCCIGGNPQTGQMDLLKWMIMADKDKPVPVLRKAIMGYAPPDTNIAELYESKTSSIVKAPAGIIAT